MQNKQTKLLFEGWRRFINEAALGSQAPIPLSQMPDDLAKAATSGGDQADKASGGDAKVPVGSLNPMQKEVIPGKALAFALGFLRDGNSKPESAPNLDAMEAIVAEDGGNLYIMDGHHRWAARTLIDPQAQVQVTKVEGVSATDLVTALNAWTKAQGRSGNPGEGDVSKFSQLIPVEIDKAIAGGTAAIGQKWPSLTADEVKVSLGKVPGANGDFQKGKQIMIQNAAKLPTEKHPQAPNRIDMPVVKNQEEINQVIKDLMAGKIDWNVPHTQTTQAALQKKAGGQPAAVKESLLKNKIRQLVIQEMKKIKR